jgi:hypothetical protein
MDLPTLPPKQKMDAAPLQLHHKRKVLVAKRLPASIAKEELEDGPRPLPLSILTTKNVCFPSNESIRKDLERLLMELYYNTP